jgi:hypothetical protein
VKFFFTPSTVKLIVTYLSPLSNVFSLTFNVKLCEKTHVVDKMRNNAMIVDFLIFVSLFGLLFDKLPKYRIKINQQFAI